RHQTHRGAKRPEVSPRRRPSRPRRRMDSTASFARPGQAVLRLLLTRPLPRLAPAKKYNPSGFRSDVSEENDETQHSTPALLALVEGTSRTEENIVRPGTTTVDQFGFQPGPRHFFRFRLDSQLLGFLATPSETLPAGRYNLHQHE